MRLKHTLLAVVGWSGSGKTTLLEKLLPLLIAHGCRVNVIKSSHHDVQIEPEGKDSARMRAAGAHEVMLASPFRYMLAHELRGESLPGLQELLARMQPADITLVEGYRTEAIPKLEVWREETGRAAIWREDATVLAVASDAAKPRDFPEDKAWLDLNNVEKISDWLFANQSHQKAG